MTLYDRAVAAAREHCPTSRPDRRADGYDEAVKAFEAVADLVGDEDVTQKLLSKMVPVVERDGKLFYIEPCDPFCIAFTWDPRLKDGADDLVPLRTIKTLHRYAYYGFFKPNIAEVLSQIPEDIVGSVCAFRTEGPGRIDDLNDELIAFDAGFHVAETTLYRKRDKEE